MKFIMCFISALLLQVSAFADDVSVTVNGNTYSCNGDGSAPAIECACTFNSGGLFDAEGNDTSCKAELQVFNKTKGTISSITSFPVTSSKVSICGKAPLGAGENDAMSDCETALKKHPFCN